MACPRPPGTRTGWEGAPVGTEGLRAGTMSTAARLHRARHRAPGGAARRAQLIALALAVAAVTVIAPALIVHGPGHDGSAPPPTASPAPRPTAFTHGATSPAASGSPGAATPSTGGGGGGAAGGAGSAPRPSPRPNPPVASCHQSSWPSYGWPSGRGSWPGWWGSASPCADPWWPHP